MHPVHEDSALTAMPGECVRMLEATPWVSTTFDLTVLPYEPTAVKASNAAAYKRARAADPDDEMARHRVSVWLCG
jgi:hypothetical protein